MSNRRIFLNNLDREEKRETNMSVDMKRTALSSSQTRNSLGSRFLKSRIAFNSNFTAKHSMARRFNFNQTGIQIANDFDPSTVFEGISDTENQLAELEENIEVVLDETDPNLEAEIEDLLDCNKSLVKKVNEIAELVASRIRKAAEFKKSRIYHSHREESDNPALKEKQKTFKKLQSEILKQKRKISDLKEEFNIISRYEIS
jgi:hypothetical protein